MARRRRQWPARCSCSSTAQALTAARSPLGLPRTPVAWAVRRSRSPLVVGLIEVSRIGVLDLPRLGHLGCRQLVLAIQNQAAGSAFESARPKRDGQRDAWAPWQAVVAHLPVRLPVEVVASVD